MLDNVLRKYRKHGATIIYCPRVKDVKRTTKWLRSRDYPVKAYYGKMKRCKRAHVQDYFLTKKHPIIVATNAFGLGIDRPDVRLDCPSALTRTRRKSAAPDATERKLAPYCSTRRRMSMW